MHVHSEERTAMTLPVNSSVQTAEATLERFALATEREAQAVDFFHQSAGSWQSRRRYYTLKSGATEEVISDITIRFLDGGDAELVELAARHALADPMICGAKVTWDSQYISPSRKPSKGSTVFGIRGDVMYRDRGFATPKPVTANFRFTDARTMILRTEYGGSAFEEELKLVGDNYRTRQTIISRAGEEIMIGQYLEKRV